MNPIVPVNSALGCKTYTAITYLNSYAQVNPCKPMLNRIDNERPIPDYTPMCSREVVRRVVKPSVNSDGKENLLNSELSPIFQSEEQKGRKYVFKIENCTKMEEGPNPLGIKFNKVPSNPKQQQASSARNLFDTVKKLGKDNKEKVPLSADRIFKGEVKGLMKIQSYTPNKLADKPASESVNKATYLEEELKRILKANEEFREKIMTERENKYKLTELVENAEEKVKFKCIETEKFNTNSSLMRDLEQLNNIDAEKPKLSFESELLEMKRFNENNEKRINEAISENSKLRLLLSEKEEDIKALKKTIDNQEKEKETISKRDSKIKELEAILSKRSLEAEKANTEIDRLSKTIDALKKELALKERLRSKENEAKYNSDLAQIKESQQRKISEMEKEKLKLSEKIDSLLWELEEADRKQNEKDRHIKILEEKSKQSEDLKSLMSAKIYDIESKTNELIQENCSLQSQTAELKKENEGLANKFELEKKEIFNDKQELQKVFQDMQREKQEVLREKHDMLREKQETQREKQEIIRQTQAMHREKQELLKERLDRQTEREHFLTKIKELETMKAGVVQAHQQELAGISKLERELHERESTINEMAYKIKQMESSMDVVRKENNNLEYSLRQSLRELQEIDKIMQFVKTENVALIERIKSVELQHQSEIHELKNALNECVASLDKERANMALTVKSLESDNCTLLNDLNGLKENARLESEKWRGMIAKLEQGNANFLDNMKINLEQEAERRLGQEKARSDSKINELHGTLKELDQQKRLLVSENYSLKQELEKVKISLANVQTNCQYPYTQKVADTFKYEQENNNLQFGLCANLTNASRNVRSRADSLSNLDYQKQGMPFKEVEADKLKSNTQFERGRSSLGGHEKAAFLTNRPLQAYDDLKSTRAHLDYMVLKRCQEIGNNI